MNLPDPALEMWPRVLPADEEELVRLAVPYVRWLNRQVVAKLTHDNDLYLAAWQAIFAREDIPADLYVWPGSACVFPGVRRQPGKMEAKGHCLRYDHNGNRLAHRVWELLGSNMSSFKIDRAGYEFVHLLPHQPTEWEKLFVQQPQLAAAMPANWRQRLISVGLPALFSNPASNCFLPGILVRPTDGNSLFRRVLWKKAIDLYGATALLPPGVAEPFAEWLQASSLPTNLRWSKCYHGDELHLQNLLGDRLAHLKKYQFT